MRNTRVRKITVTAILSAIAFVLMFLEISIPIMPGFIKLDFSELPALIAAFSMGPISGVAVCFFKNLLHLFMSSTGGIGELANFLIGIFFVLPAGLIYKKMNSRKGALIGSLVGAAAIAIASVPINYFLVYPLYDKVMGFTNEIVMGMYQIINPNVENLFEALLIFNMPFTFVKALFSVIITFLIYKKISPLIQGKTKI